MKIKQIDIWQFNWLKQLKMVQFECPNHLYARLKFTKRKNLRTKIALSPNNYHAWINSPLKENLRTKLAQLAYVLWPLRRFLTNLQLAQGFSVTALGPFTLPLILLMYLLPVSCVVATSCFSWCTYFLFGLFQLYPVWGDVAFSCFYAL